MTSRLAKTRPTLTDSQERQLVALLDLGAVGRDVAASIYELQKQRLFANPLVIGKLRDRGLADSRTVKPKGGGQYTDYWLTAAGVEKARELRRAPNG